MNRKQRMHIVTQKLAEAAGTGRPRQYQPDEPPPVSRERSRITLVKLAFMGEEPAPKTPEQPEQGEQDDDQQDV